MCRGVVGEMNALIEAVKVNNVQSVRELVRSGVDVNAVENDTRGRHCIGRHGQGSLNVCRFVVCCCCECVMIDVMLMCCAMSVTGVGCGG